METAAKHLAWAGSLIACVYLATSHNWVPIQLQIVASAPNQPVAALSQNIPAASPAALPTGQLALAAPGQAPASPQVVQPATLQAATALASQGVVQPAAPIASAAYATIEDAKVARQVMEMFGKLEAIEDIPAGTPEGQVATIFFDPRCPYCHAAFTALHGKIAARWVPTLGLGDTEAGLRMTAAILSSPDRLAALKSAFDKTTPAVPTEPASPEIVAKIAENMRHFATIFAAAPGLRGPVIPFIFVPRPDGRVAIMSGYEPGDDAKMRAVLTGS